MRDESRLFKLVPWFIGVTAVLTVLIFIAASVLAYKSLSELSNCHPAIISTTKNGETATTIGCKVQAK